MKFVFVIRWRQMDHFACLTLSVHGPTIRCRCSFHPLIAHFSCVKLSCTPAQCWT
jgi:hypothetical protein